MEKVTSLARLLSSYISGSSRIFTLRISCLRFLDCCLWLLGGLVLVASPAEAAVKAGDILVVDPNAGTRCLELIIGEEPFPCGALFVVNPKTGQRTILSDFGDPAQGHLGNADLTGVAVGRAGQIFVTALFSGDPADVGGALFRVNPRTGNRTVLSNFSQGVIQGN